MTRTVLSAVAPALIVAGLGAQSRPAPIPKLEVDPFWPKMPDTFFMGPVRGLSVDASDHVWIVQDSTPITQDIRGAAANPPLAECCVAAPPR